MIINHNIAALNTYRQLNNNNVQGNKALEKLSSGLRINRAGDDAAGLAISEKMRAQIRGLDQASRNAQDGISLLQTAEGALNETQSILQRMRELSVQASNDTATASDRAEMQKELDQLKNEVDRIAFTTEFNTKKLLNGSLSASRELQATKAISNTFEAMDIDATAGTANAGHAVAIKEAIAGQEGQGYKLTSSVALTETVIVRTDVNNAFNITINGKALEDVTIAAGSYTREDFASAVQTAINDALTSASANEYYKQVNVTVDDNNKLVIQTRDTGSGTSIVVEAPTAAGTKGDALATLGFGDEYRTDAKGDGTIHATTNTVVAATSDQLDITIGAKTETITLDAGTYNKEDYISHIQEKIDTAFGAGALTVTVDVSDNMVFTLNEGLRANDLAVDTTTNGAINVGTVTATAATTVGTASSTLGVDHINARAEGTVISTGINDVLNLTVDGGTAQNITLSAGTYKTRQDLVDEINAKIDGNLNLKGKVEASLGADNKIVFTSATTGSDSSVAVAGTAQTAIGRAATAGIITSTVDLAGGITADAANNTLTFTLGTKSSSLDLTSADEITALKNVSSNTLARVIQDHLDSEFGENAITVNIVADGGAEYLQFTPNAGASAFTITGNGAAQYIGAATNTATLSTAPNNVDNAGTDFIDGNLGYSAQLVTLADTDGNSLGLEAGNVITFSGTQNGKAFSTSITVNTDTTVQNLIDQMKKVDELKNANITLDTETGKLNIEGEAGAAKDLSNMKFHATKSATDSSEVGAFNRVFNNMNVTQQAQDAKSDVSLAMHIGANQGQTLSVDINEMSSSTLKVRDIDVTTQAGAETATTVINNAIETVSAERSKLGALQNRLEHTINNLGTSSENLTAAESRIRDVDMAKEMMEFTKNNILSQAAQAMLAQANQQPQGVLQLLR